MGKVGVPGAQGLLDRLGAHRIGRNQRHDQPLMARPQPPQMQVRDPRAHFAGQKAADFVRQFGIGVGIQQHHGAVLDQPIGPGGDHRRAYQRRYRVQKAPAAVIGAGQRHDGQNAGGRICQHMHIGGAHVVVVAMGMAVFVAMPVIVGILQDQGRNQVHRQADHRDQKGIAVADIGRRDQPLCRFHRHQKGGDAQHDGAGKGGQVAELA